MKNPNPDPHNDPGHPHPDMPQVPETDEQKRAREEKARKEAEEQARRNPPANPADRTSASPPLRHG